MATYKGIKGVKVQTKATDPTASEAAGTVWYNSTSPVALKYGTEGAGTWATGGALNTPRYSAVGAGVDVPTSIIFAGAIPAKGDTEKYDGSTWTEVNNLTSARYSSAGCGTQPAALSFAGNPGSPSAGSTVTEEWNDTSWIAQNGLNTGRIAPHGSGIQTAALCIGGYNSGNVAIVEDYDGTCWTEVAALLTATYAGTTASQGTPSASLVFTGTTPASPAGGKLCESFDGTSWTEVADTNTGRNNAGGSGVQTLALCFGGDAPGVSPANTVNTEKWDGTSWTETNNLAIGGYDITGSGTQGSAMCAAGAPTPTRGGVSEEWVDPVYTIKTVTVS